MEIIPMEPREEIKVDTCNMRWAIRVILIRYGTLNNRRSITEI